MGSPRLNKFQVAARARAEVHRRTLMLERRLDRHVIAAEKLRSGKIREQHYRLADLVREQLRAISH
jgi:hypothetical protein